MKQLTTLIAVLPIDCSDHCFTSSFFHHNIVKGITIKLGACYLHPGDHHRLHWEPPRCPRRHLRQDHEEHHKHPHLQPCGDEDCDCDQIWFNPKNFQMSDLLFIVLCVPFTAADYALTSVWPFGDLWCSLVSLIISYDNLTYKYTSADVLVVR